MKTRRKMPAFLLAFILVFACSPVPSSLGAESAAASASNSVIAVASDAASSANTSGETSAAVATSAETSGAQLTVQDAENATGIDASLEGTAYAAGEVIVVYKDGTTQTEATKTVQSTDTVATDAITDDTLLATTVEGDTLTSETGDAPMAMVNVADGTTVAQAVAELETDSNVAYAQPNYRYTLMEDSATDELQAEAAEELTTFDATLTEQSTSINDPYASQQWQLAASSSYGVGCYEAWDYARCNGSVGVAIVDTGCLTTHEDLADNIEGAYNAVSRTSGNSSVTDNLGHGTHVAGIIAAETNNGVGVSGVSYNAKIIPVKAVSDNGYFYTSGLLEAYNYIIKNQSAYNIKVVNMSLGGYWDGEPSTGTDDDALLALVDTANSAGILTVCAAGNADSSSRYTASVPYDEYPGDYSTCISVINTTSGGTRSSSSNYNPSDVAVPTSTTSDVNGTKDISAPGTNIYSTYSFGTSSYASLSGTSMASPVVAGVAALVFAADSGLTPAEVKSILYSTATDLGDSGWDRTYGWGLVNAAAAVKQAVGTSFAIMSSRCTVDDATYTGSALTPTVIVRNSSGTVLTEGTDYTTSYSNNIDAGTGSVTISATGSAYSGTVTKTFTIYPAAISAASVSSLSSQLYDTDVHTPTPTLTWNGVKLTSGTDYTLAYTDSSGSSANPKLPGVYTVNATGTGNFTGTGSTNFTIYSRYADFPDTKAAVAASGFANVWYAYDGWLDYVVENGLMSGYTSNGYFGPLDAITRGQVAVILYRYACAEDSTLEPKYGSTTDSASYASSTVFADEASGAYYTAAINWAMAVGVLTGDSSTGYTTVRPNSNVQRQELCAMIARFAQKVGGASTAEGSVDYSSIQGMNQVSSWATSSVKWCASYGIIGGVNVNGTYYMNPTDSTWRASMAKMITVTVRDVL